MILAWCISVQIEYGKVCVIFLVIFKRLNNDWSQPDRILERTLWRCWYWKGSNCFSKLSWRGANFIGIDNEGRAYGVQDPDGDILKIKNRIKSNILPSAMGLIDFGWEVIDGKYLIKLTIVSG